MSFDRLPPRASEPSVEDLRAEIERLEDIIRGLTGQDEQPIEGLTATQMRIARVLSRANGRTVSRLALIDAISWDRGTEEPSFRAIDCYVKCIRKQRPDIGKRIKTHYGIGYSMEPADAS